MDEDGDLVCRRKRRKRSVQHLIICHALATRLNDVGLQVWRGALLLCDHIMTCQSLDSAVVLELGAGCGMTSLAASLAGARTVFCTDAHRPSLENAQRNANANNVHSALRVRQLDWSAVDIWPQQSDDRFGWGTADLHALKRATVLLAADCVYDDSGTTALVPMLARLLPALDASAVCFISLERRMNFSASQVCGRGRLLLSTSTASCVSRSLSLQRSCRQLLCHRVSSMSELLPWSCGVSRVTAAKCKSHA